MFNLISSNVSVPFNTPKQTAPDPALTLTVTASPDNVTSGDKSENSVEINLVTPKKEINTTVTREQAVDRLENKLLKNTLNSTLGTKKSVPGPVKSLLIADTVSNSGLDAGGARETAVELYSTKLTYDAAKFAFNTFGASQAEPSSSASTSSNNSENLIVTLSNQATNYYVKSTLFFSLTDRVGENLDKFS